MNKKQCTEDGFSVYWVNQYTVPRDTAGGTRHFDMARALSAMGYHIVLVASDLELSSRQYFRRTGPKDRQPIHEEADDVVFAWLPAGHYQRNDWRRALSMLAFAQHTLVYLLRAAKRGDVVIGSSPHLFAAAAARLAAFLKRATYVLEVRDLWPESLTAVHDRWSPVVPVFDLMARSLYRTSDAIIILAQGARDPIVKKGGDPNRLYYIPNGVDTHAFETGNPEVPDDLYWVRSTPTFVYTGAHGPANGLVLALHAAKHLERRGYHAIRILFVGDGPSKPELQQQAAHFGLANVVFHAPLPKSRIPDLLRSCTGGLMILKDVELFQHAVSPNKLFDYLAADLPVVTNVPGDVSYIVFAAGAGIAVAPDCSRELADALISVVEQPQEFAAGSAYVNQYHDRRILAQQLATLIDRVACQYHP